MNLLRCIFSYCPIEIPVFAEMFCSDDGLLMFLGVPVYLVCFKGSDKLIPSFFRMTEDGGTTSFETSDLTKYCPTNLYTKVKNRKACFLSILNWQNHYSTQVTVIFSLRTLLGYVTVLCIRGTR